MGTSYFKRRSQGVCVLCAEPSNGKTHCEACRKRAQQTYRLAHRGSGAKARNRRLALKDRGICQACAKAPSVDSKTLCERCLDDRKVAAKARRRARSDAFAETCRICLIPLYGAAAKLDHCHKTGAIRGWLCAFCNTGLGMFQDDPQRLLAAAAYLQEDWSTNPQHTKSSRAGIVVTGRLRLPP